MKNVADIIDQLIITFDNCVVYVRVNVCAQVRADDRETFGRTHDRPSKQSVQADAHYRNRAPISSIHLRSKRLQKYTTAPTKLSLSVALAQLLLTIYKNHSTPTANCALWRELCRHNVVPQAFSSRVI